MAAYSIVGHESFEPPRPAGTSTPEIANRDFQTLLHESRQEMSNPSAALPKASTVYLGPAASYTHQAALKVGPNDQLQPLQSIAEVFHHIQSANLLNGSQSACGVVPVENSTNGPVAATLDLLADSAGTLKNVRVVGETSVPVRHCLLGRRPPGHDSSTPTTAIPRFGHDQLPSLAHLTCLQTHPQAWTQCSRFLAAYGLTPPGKAVAARGMSSTGAGGIAINGQTECVDASSTSSAAAMAAADATGQTAAISSALAAEAHGVEILMEGLEDSDQNVTRFLVLANAANVNGGQQKGHGHSRRRKAMFTFTLAPSDPRRPGALSDTLAVFGRHEINLTSINSRPRGMGVPWEYCFLIEVDVGWDDDGKDEEREHTAPKSDSRTVKQPDTGSRRLDETLTELDTVVGEWTWKGTWSVDE